MEEEVDFLRGSFEEAIQRVDEIPGIGCRNAQEILAETGLDKGRFPSAAHYASWAKLCQGNNESGGKRLSGHTSPGIAGFVGL